jgi:hypothetical protein
MRLHSLYVALTILAGSTAIGFAQSKFRKPFSGNKYTPRLSDISRSTSNSGSPLRHGTGILLPMKHSS